MHPKCSRADNRARALRRVCPGILGLAIFGITPDASAIVRRHDIADSSYIALGNDAKYTSVGAIRNNGVFTGSGILISPKWVLTAGHLTSSAGPLSFNIGGTTISNGGTFNESQHFTPFTGNLQDGSDIGLLQLNTAVTTITPATRYFFGTENTMVGTSVGFGDEGTGLTGDQFGTGFFKRGMQNVIDALGTAIGSGPTQYSSKTILSDFDDPGNVDTFNAFGSNVPSLDNPLEGSTAGGDSGGGVFVDLNTRWYVDAVHSFIVSFNPPFGNGLAPNSSYSNAIGSTRVSVHNEWIDDNITNNWKVAADGSFGTASNWSVGTFTSGAPTNFDLAGFNVPGSYTVTFGSNVSNHMMLARRGDVTLDLNNFSYTLTSTMFEGGLVVGRYGGNDASVTFTRGTVNVSGSDVIVGQSVGAIGRLTLGSTATLVVAGNTYVGGDFNGVAGTGILTLKNTTSTLNVGGLLKVTANGTVNYDHGTLTANTLEIQSGGHVMLAVGGDKLLRTTALSIASGGLIDLSDNDMLINYVGGGPDAQVRQWLIDGSIYSSAATSTRGLGYGNNVLLNRGSFDGVGIDLTTELVKYTYFGDGDLDGDVDAHDLGLFATHWQATSNWIGGDYNYDGFVDVRDLLLLATNWMAGVGAPLGPSFGAALAEAGLPTALAAPVPEPTMITSLLLATPMLLRRRRRVG